MEGATCGVWYTERELRTLGLNEAIDQLVMAKSMHWYVLRRTYTDTGIRL